MVLVVGIVLVLVATVVGFLMHRGNILVLLQLNEFVILGGAGFGSFLAANGVKNLDKARQSFNALLKPDPHTKEGYFDLLKMMFQLFTVARREGLLGVESHVERPAESAIFQAHPSVLKDERATNYICDTMKVVLTGAVGPHDLGEMMEMDIEAIQAEERIPIDAIHTVGDAMPGFGIVAAVLGVIIAMEKIGGGPTRDLGQSVAGALVGTFLGVLIAYGICAPIARAMELRLRSHLNYLMCIRSALVSFARGESPITCVEFARRNIDPALRPGFAEMENAVRERAA